MFNPSEAWDKCIEKARRDYYLVIDARAKRAAYEKARDDLAKAKSEGVTGEALRDLKVAHSDAFEAWQTADLLLRGVD